MAKKKKKKEKKETFDHKEELIGIALILCSILGIGKYGIVGRAIASFSLFFSRIYLYGIITCFFSCWIVHDSKS